MGPTNVVRHSWNGLESAFGAGTKCCLGMHRLASGDMACNDLAWLPPQAMVDTAQCMFMWRLLHIAPARTRAVYDAVSTSAADGGARQCTRPWHKHVHNLLADALGPTALAQCAARSKTEWRTTVKRAIALKYRRHWLDKIAAKTAPPTPAFQPQQFVGHTVSVPSQEFGEEDWDTRVFTGDIQHYCPTSKNWRVVFPRAGNAVRYFHGAKMRKHGPTDMRLATAADQLEPDHHTMAEYLAHAHDSLSRAWYLQPGELVPPPPMQRWHARARSGCGLAAVYGKASAEPTFRYCTCSHTVETVPHVHLRCPHYNSVRGAFTDALDHWRAAMCLGQGPGGVDLTRAEAVAWIHYSTGAPVWTAGCAEHDVLRQAAWMFWRDTRHRKDIPCRHYTESHSGGAASPSVRPRAPSRPCQCSLPGEHGNNFTKKKHPKKMG
jgi:hypothetical protein